jgi:hypothetical protein
MCWNFETKMAKFFRVMKRKLTQNTDPSLIIKLSRRRGIGEGEIKEQNVRGLNISIHSATCS